MPTYATSLLKTATDNLRLLMRSYGSPERAFDAADQELRAKRYELLYQMAAGTAFEDSSTWAEYKRHGGLYRHIRQLWDQAGPLTDFYAYRVWSGTIPDDGLKLPNGVDNAVPFSPDTNPALAAAAAALMHDWAFQQRMTTLVKTTASVGELLAELKDNVVKGRVDLELIWPAFVEDIELNQAGDVVAYALEYYVIEEEIDAASGKRSPIETYLYRREVTKQDFRTYKDRVLTAFADADGNELPAIVDNPYGFVPACWFRHHPTLGARGEPAIAGTMIAADEVNSLVAHLIDKTHIALKAPVVVSGSLGIGALQRAIGSMMETARRAFTEDWGHPTDGRQELDVLEAPAGTKVETVDVSLSQSLEVSKDLKAGVEKRIPEVTVFEKLREMTQITGPAAEALFGDVSPKYRAIASHYDRQLVKLLQMGIAIGGWRLNRGDWNGTRTVDELGQPIPGLTERQERFRSFNLGSFGQGNLPLNIMPRELFPATPKEKMDLLEQKRRVLPFMTDLAAGIEAGHDEDEIQQWIDAHEAQVAKERAQSQQQAVELAQVKGSPPQTNGRQSAQPPR